MIRASTLFTTHTPVPAGHDSFHVDLFKLYMGSMAQKLKISLDDFLFLGKATAQEDHFNMSYLASNLSQEINGVSMLHGKISKEVLSELYKGFLPEELENIGYVTNGVHYPTWAAPEWKSIHDKFLIPEALAEDIHDYEEDEESRAWRNIYKVQDDQIWETKSKLRDKLINYVKQRFSDTHVQRNENPNQDFLFMEKDIYDYKLDYELTILGYYCNHDGYDLPKYCVKVMCYPHLEEWTSRNILSNYKFYAPELKSMSNVVITDTIDDCVNLVSDSNFNKSTPSIVLHNDKEIINIRHVNYHIDDKGGYVQKENVETRNVLFLKDTSTTMLISHNTDLDENNMYIGLEDVRIFSYKNRLFYNANRGLGYSKFQNVLIFD